MDSDIPFCSPYDDDGPVTKLGRRGSGRPVGSGYYGCSTINARIPEVIKGKISRVCKTMVTHKIIYLCGHAPELSARAAQLEAERNAVVLAPRSNKEFYKQSYKPKIGLCDLVVVINKDKQIDEQTQTQIAYAMSLDIPIELVY